MTKSAREVIADCFSNATDPVCEDICPADFSDEVIRMLAESGLVILPKEPSEGMIEAGRTAFFHTDPELETSDVFCSAIYRAMISHAEGEKG